MIICDHLSKSFRATQKDPGLIGSVRSFFAPKYRTVDAVRDFSFTCQPGELLGLLGPNGAGKTTIMKMLSGLIAPSTGNTRVFGHEPFARSKAFRKQISLVMGQKSQLWWDIPAMDSFELLRAYYETPRAEFKRRLDELSSLLQVGHVLRTHVRKLSLGERMKLELIAALLHEPSVLFLDEPTIGLDVVAQDAIREFLRAYHQRRQTTILLTSHYMADVEALCDRIVLIIGGEKRFDGPIAKFEQILGRDKFLSLAFSQPIQDNSPLWAECHARWSEDRRSVELRIPEERLRSVTTEVLSRYPVVDFSTERLPIERVMQSILSNPQLLNPAA